MKRILVCALAAMILMASCLTAFAAPTYTTTTSYVKVNDVEYLQVSSTVINATEGDMITFLAYDENAGDTIEDNEVVYIDQKTVPADRTLNFTYNTDKAKLTGVDLKFGTDGDAAPAGDANVPSRTYTVSYKNATYTVVVPTAAVVDTVITTDLVLVTGEKLATATYGGANVLSAVSTADGKITIQDSTDFNGGTIVVTSEATIEPIDPPTINNDKTLSAVFAKEVDGKLEETLTVFGYAISDLATGWGGIVVSKDADAIDAYKDGDADADVDVYEALYKGIDGDFAVQLVNKTGTEDLTAGPVYACIYVTNSQHTAYGDTLTLTVAE